MTKAVLFISLIILFAGFLYWFDSTREMLEVLAPNSAPQISTQAPSRQLQRPEVRQVSETQPVQVQKPSPQPETKQQLFDEVVALEQQLEEARSELQVRLEELEGLRQQQGEERSLSGSSTGDQLQVETANLTTLLQASQAAEKDIDRNVEAALREEARTTQHAQNQTDQEIRTLQRRMEQTQREIANWDRQLSDRTVAEARVTELRGQLTAQEQSLESLRNQRIQNSADSLARIQAINNAAQSEHAQLRQNQSALQEQIMALRSEIQRNETAQKNAERNKADLEAQISKAQESHKAQQQKVEEIRKTLNQKRQQLQTKGAFHFLHHPQQHIQLCSL